jgi:hypothetical protein
LKHVHRIARHPLGLVAVIAVVAAVGGAWLFGSGELWSRFEAPEPGVAVEVPVRPQPGARRDAANHVTVTLRWGHTSKPAREPALSTRWDGYVSLDCGELASVVPLGLEPPGSADQDPRTTGDEVGVPVRGEGGDVRVYFRSQVGTDWDGLRLDLTSCNAPDTHDRPTAASVLRVATPFRSYAARLDWQLDDFVTIKAGNKGASLDIHIAAQRNLKAVGGARVTASPTKPVESEALAGVDEPVPEEPAVR